MSVNFPGTLTATMEKVGVRGAPTLLGKLSKFPVLRETIATVTLPSGQRLTLPAYDGYWCRYVYAAKPYEPDVERIFRRFGKGRVLVDCGANIGYWSARHKDFGFTDAIAIEANPKLVRFLRINYSGCVIDKAVYSRSGEQLTFSGDDACGHLGDARGHDAAQTITVETIALKDLNVTSPALVKLDVEGAEIDALQGLGDMDAIVVYEDFPRQGMKTTRYLLDRGWKLSNDQGESISNVEQVSHDLGKGVPHNLIAMR